MTINIFRPSPDDYMNDILGLFQKGDAEIMDLDSQVIEFTALDLCDKCVGRAYTLARHEDFGELMFCQHHSREHRQNLFDDGWEIIDDTLGLEDLGFKISELV